MFKQWRLYLVLILVSANFSVFGAVFQSLKADTPSLHFLPVGQGDATLLSLPRTQVLIDTGPSAKVITQLDKLIPSYRRQIDLLFITHPNLDHYGGLFELMKRYRVRLIIFTGIQSTQASYQNLLRLIKEKQIPVLYARRGQEIKFVARGKEQASLLLLWPELKLDSTEIVKERQLNDTSIVSLFSASGVRGLFTGDISTKVEQLLLPELGEVDFLKVPHHGSRYSSSVEFLEKLRPKIAIIEVGKNSYEHPTLEVLKRLEAVGAKIFRTDLDGLVKLEIKAGQPTLLIQSESSLSN